MNNLRTTLWALLFTIVVILWFKWDAVNTPVAEPAAPTATQTSTTGADKTLPTPSGNQVVTGAPTSQGVPGSTPAPSHSGNIIHVKTDVLSLSIDTRGGTIVDSKLLKYSVSVKDRNPIKLFESTSGKVFQLQTGLNGDRDNNATHEVVFTSPKSSYELQGDEIRVPLVWENDGIKVTKTFIFKKGLYDFEIQQTVENNSQKPWNGYQYAQLKRNEVVIERGLTTFNTFAGAAYSTPDNKYNKLSFSDLASEPLDVKDVTGGWEAMIEHYFMGALIPPQTEKSTFYSGKLTDGTYRIGFYGNTQSVNSGQSITFSHKGFVGPKIKNDLARIAPNLDKATDYGWLFFISEFLFNVLNWVHSVVKNWGWAIVIVTLAIKTLLFPLAAKSFKSMAKMRKFQPEMERIKENYAEDRQLQGKKMMELYKKEGINPASGCLPILVQIPIFLAFYYMLMESVELRQAPWIFWIKDLSIKDPLYVLPVINMVLMFVQQRLNPPPSDPMQRRVMMFLPLIFGFMFLFFPSGLVLYWAVSNLFSIIQQYIITKRYGGLAHPLSHAEDKHYHPKK